MKHLINSIAPANDLLKKYESLILKWQKAVNLVSKKDLSVIWERHILDSAQVYFHISRKAEILVDIGSGGGFPGVVIAILNKCLNGSLKKIYLIESDNKKSIFLQEVSRELDLGLIVINERIERVENLKCDVLTSRGLASVSEILNYAQPFLRISSEILLLKGENVYNELKDIENIMFDIIPSLINKEGCLLKIKEGECNE